MQQEGPVVVFIGTRSRPDILILTVDGVRYEYETSPFHMDRFKAVYRRSPLKALNYVKENSSSCVKTT